jgi:hypothetical protein
MGEKYDNPNKVYISVKAVSHQDGRLQLVSFLWEDGCEVAIDRVIDARRAASLKGGGVGMRYTCMVQGKQTYLFWDEARWFIPSMHSRH